MLLHYACLTKFSAAVEVSLPKVQVPARLTRLIMFVYSRYLDDQRSHTVHIRWSFASACAQFWNYLVDHCFDGNGVAAFRSQINRAIFFD